MTLSRFRILHDHDPYNPRRENDCADVMYCEHSRYDLGDDGADNPIECVTVMALDDGNGKSYALDSRFDDDGYDRGIDPYDLTFESVRDMLEEHVEELEADLADATDDTSALAHDPETEALRRDLQRATDGLDFLTTAKIATEYRERPGVALCRPLYLYDHGGITISAGKFSCPWDSGQVGWQYVTEEALQAEWNGDRDRALAYMDATLSEYDDYLRGEVYGFELETGVIVTDTRTYPDGREVKVQRIEWNHEDSCWGFFGDKPEDSGMTDHLDGKLVTPDMLSDAAYYSNVGEWQYHPDVPEELRHD